MTVSSAVNRNDYAGNGSTTSFAVSFRFLQNSDVKATLRDALSTETLQVETTDYTLTGAGGAGGGTLVMIVAPPSGTTLTIQRDVPATQETDYVENDEFPAEAHEDALDKLTMLVQQQGEDSTRHIGFSDTVSDATGAAVELSQDATQRADKFLGFDTAGNIVTKTASAAGLVDQDQQDKRYGPTFATVAAMVAANPVALDGVIVNIVPGMWLTVEGNTTAGVGHAVGLVVAGDSSDAKGRLLLATGDTWVIQDYNRKTSFAYGSIQNALDSHAVRGGLTESLDESGGLDQATLTMAEGGTLQMGAAFYSMSGKIDMDLGCHLLGMGTKESRGTTIFANTGYTDNALITNLPTLGVFYDNMRIENLACDGNGLAVNCIELENLGETTDLRNVIMRDATGSNFKLTGQSVPVSMKNFSSFTAGAYGYDIDFGDDGSSAGNAFHLDGLSGDNNATGLIKLSNGGDRTSVVLTNVKSERRSPGAQDNVIHLDDYKGTLIIVGGHSFSDTTTAAPALIKITGTERPKIIILGITLTDTTNIIDDQVASRVVSLQGQKFIHAFYYGFSGNGYEFLGAGGNRDAHVANTGIFPVEVSVLDDVHPRAQVGAGVIKFGPGTIAPDVEVKRLSANVLTVDKKMTATLGLGAGNSAAATTPGSVTKKLEVFDAAGASLGFLPIYDAIT